jgi:hypothetical protein
MTTLETAKEILKQNKIGKGCKLTFVSNKIFIGYPVWKVLNGTFAKEVNLVKSLFNTPINVARQGNSGGINIWL